MSKPLFQKRHYEIVAKILRELPPEDGGVQSEFMKVFRDDNPKFNEDKFWRAINGTTK